MKKPITFGHLMKFIVLLAVLSVIFFLGRGIYMWVKNFGYEEGYTNGYRRSCQDVDGMYTPGIFYYGDAYCTKFDDSPELLNYATTTIDDSMYSCGTKCYAFPVGNKK